MTKSMSSFCIFGGLSISNSAYACFAGYFAPSFMELTDPVIGVGVAVILVSAVLSYARKLGIVLFAIPTIYFLVSYFGHFNYGGDCGTEIVLMNKVALSIAVLWFFYELGMYYVFRSNEKT